MPPRIVVLCLVLVASSLGALAQTPPGDAPVPPPNAQPPAPPAIERPAQTQPAQAMTGVTPEQALQRARLAIENGKSREALEILTKILEVAPTMLEAQVLYGEQLIEANQYNAARSAFKTVLEKEPKNFRANLGMGKIYMGNNVWPQAEYCLTLAESVAPPNGIAEVKRLLAFVYAKTSQLDKSINKALQAVEADPEDLAALQTLAEIRRSVATYALANSRGSDAKQITTRYLKPATDDAERLINKCMQRLLRDPWKREPLARLATAYQFLYNAAGQGVLQMYYQAYCERDPASNKPIDKLIGGAGPDASAILVRMTDVLRQQALITLIGAEQDALEMTLRAVDDAHNPASVPGWLAVVSSCQQLQELMIRLAGNDVMRDTTLQKRATDACQQVLKLEPNNEYARQFLAGNPPPATAPTTAPADTGAAPEKPAAK